MTLLGQPGWMASAAVVATLDALEAAGGEARFVGGCVRNALIGQPINDIDIATTLPPRAVVAALRAAGIKAVPTGIEHGTVTAAHRGTPLEITTLRRDVETDGRRAVVAFTTDWAEDAQRRDFTLNALYADRTGSVFDPTGRGVEDARAGRIVFVGDAQMRLREDYLRALRFFRFFAWYGQGEADPAALAACAAVKDQLTSLAAERIWAELRKLLAARDPRPTLRLMAETGVLEVLLGEADLSRFEAMVALSDEPILRLASLLPGKAAETARRLRLSNAERDRLIAALEPLQVPGDAFATRRQVYGLGAATFIDRALVAKAAGADLTDALAIARSWTAPVFPLTGEDALAAGIAKGPAVGQALREVESWWVEGDFRAAREALLVRLNLPPE